MRSVRLLKACALLGMLVLMLSALSVRGGDDDLTPVERQLMDAWFKQPEPYTPTTIKDLRQQDPWEKQLAADQRRVIESIGYRRPPPITPETIRFNQTWAKAAAGDADAQIHPFQMMTARPQPFLQLGKDMRAQIVALRLHVQERAADEDRAR